MHLQLSVHLGQVSSLVLGVGKMIYAMSEKTHTLSSSDDDYDDPLQ